MSIKNPWPNIKDNEFNDNTTLSSSLINAAFEFIKDQKVTVLAEGNIITFKTCLTDDLVSATLNIIPPEDGISSVNVITTGLNLFGGEALKDGIVASMPSSTVDADNKTVTFASGATLSQRITDNYMSGKFKENTQYTFILSLEKTSGTGSNLRIYYTDGSYTAVPSLSGPNVKELKTVTTMANKTVNYLSKTNQAGSTIVYYDECGVFEGNSPVFEAYHGDIYNIDLGETITTETDIDIDTTGISTYNGYNNIWHAAEGDISVKYKTTIRCLLDQ